LAVVGSVAYRSREIRESFAGAKGDTVANAVIASVPILGFCVFVAYPYLFSISFSQEISSYLGFRDFG
jgi:hypothetical protein